MKLLYILMILCFSTTLFSNELKDYSFTFQDEDLIIALNLEEEPDEQIFNLKNPFRLIIKLKNTKLGKKIKKDDKINNIIINNIMTMQYARNGITNSKIIISLKKEVAYTVDKFGSRLLIILKNVKSNDQIASQIEENEKAEIEKNKNVIESINYQYDNEDLMFSVKMKKEAKFKLFELTEPFRLFLDIDNAKLSEKMKNEYNYKDDYFKRVLISKMSRNGKDKVRMSLFLKDKRSFTVEQINNIVIITIKAVKRLKTFATKEVKKKVSDINIIKSINHQYDNEDLMFSVRLKDEAKFNIFELTEPFRLFLDIEDVELGPKMKKEYLYKNDFLEKVFINKMSRNGKNKVRMSLFLKDKKSFTIEKINNVIIVTVKGAKKLKTFATKKELKKIKKAKTLKKSSSNANTIESINYQYDNEDLMFSVKLKKKAKINTFDLTKPFRLFLDIDEAELGKNIKEEYTYKDDYFKQLFISKMSRNGKSKLRLSLFLKERKAYSVEVINNVIIITIKGVKKLKSLAKKSSKVDGEPSNGNLVEDINYQYDNEDLMFSVKLKKQAKFQDFELSEPFRLFLDIDDIGIKFNSKLKQVMKFNDEFIKKVILTKMKRNGKSRVRVSLFLKEKRPYTVENINNNIIFTIKGAKKLKTFVAKTIKKSKKNIKTKVKEEVNKNDITDIIDYSYSDNSLLIALKLPKNTENLKYYHLFKPFRIILDLKDMKLIDIPKKEKNYDDNYIRNVKFIKYKRSGKVNTKVILSFNDYKPFEIEKINKTVLITLSNVGSNDTKLAKSEENNIKEEASSTKTDSKEDLVEEVISFKKDTKAEKRKRKKLEKKKKEEVIVTKSNFISNKQNKLNKVVFKLYKKGARITIKTQDLASYETSLEGKVFILTLNNAIFGSRMASLSLNTEFFKRIVKKIIPKKRGKNLIIKIILSKSKNPKITQKKGLLELTF